MKNKVKNKKTHYGYAIPYASNTEVTRCADPDDRWSADSTASTWEVRNVLYKCQELNANVVSPFELVLGVEYYLVYLVYSSGDSFSNHSGYDIVFVDVFKDSEKANKLKQTIEKNNSVYLTGRDLGDNAYNVGYEDECGNKKSLYCAWNGYFESLDYVVVLPVTMVEKTYDYDDTY